MRKITWFAFLLVTSFGVAQDFRFGKVTVEELQEEVHPKDADADAAILYREQFSHIDYFENDGLMLTTEVYERIKIYNTDGFDWGTQQIPLYTGGSKNESVGKIKGVTYTLDGDKIEESKLRNDGIFDEEKNKFYDVKKFTMPNLQPGCVIEFQYEVVSPYLSTIDEIRLQEEIPVNKADVSFYTPEWLVYQLHRKGIFPLDIEQTSKAATINYRVRQGVSNGGSVGFAQRSSVGSGVQMRKIDYQKKGYKVLAQDIPAMREEAYSSNIDNYRAALSFELSFTQYPGEPMETITSSWEAVSKTIYDSENFGGQLKSVRFFDDDIDELLTGANDPVEKLARIYEFVKQKMVWNKYIGIYTDEGVKEAYKSGVGNSADINLMLVSMLRYAGLDANPVILSTRDNGIPVFPTRNGFNDVIAGAKIGEHTFLMDATNKMGMPDLLDEELLNWNGRVIREDGSSEWVNLYPSKHATESTIISSEITEDLVAVGTLQSRYTGNYGLTYRKNLGSRTEEEQLKAFEQMHSGVDIADLELKNALEVSNPLEVAYNFEMLNGVEEVGGKLYVSPLLHVTTTENPFKSEVRAHPVDFKFPWKDRYIISIKIPEGYTVESLPESALYHMTDKMASYVYRVSASEDKINISTEMAFNSSIIAPDYYQDLKKFYETIVTKQNEKIVLTKI